MRFLPRSLLTVVAFVGTGVILSTFVGVTISRARFEAKNTYTAMFSDASGLRHGSDVRASGVTVGRVSSVVLNAKEGVRAEFSISERVPVTTATQARIRYANLTGDRYLDLTQPEGGSATALPDGGTIGLSHTQPALDLDDFFAGFDPLMQALDPGEVNQLTSSIIAVTQGQAGSVEGLLAHVASFTSTLAERDDLIGAVVQNLAAALASIDERRDDLDQLIVNLARLTDGLAKDRKEIGSSLKKINTLAVDTERVLSENRAPIHTNVANLQVMSKSILKQSKLVDYTLDRYVPVISRLARAAAYGSFYNFYLCGLGVRIDTNTKSDATNDAIYLQPFIESKVKRCQFTANRQGAP